MLTKFFCFFLILFINTGTAQIADTTSKARDKVGISVGSGAQVLLIDENNILFGTNLVINSLWYDRILLSADLHLAISSHFLDNSEFYVHDISSASLMPGYRVYLNDHSAFQFQSGISYGSFWYRGKKHINNNGGGSVTTTYDEEKINFIGLPFKLSYQLYYKKVGFEIYVSANLHPHYETAAGLNVFLGKLK